MRQVLEPAQPIFQGSPALRRAVHNPASERLWVLVDEFGFPLDGEKQIMIDPLILAIRRGEAYRLEFGKIGKDFDEVLKVLFPKKNHKEISTATGISSSLITLIISGDRTLTELTFDKLSRFFRKSV